MRKLPGKTGRRNLIVVLLLALALGGGAIFALGRSSGPAEAALGGQEVTVYKTATCGCCQVYTRYLDGEGVNMKAIDVPDLDAIKAQYGIPSDMESCHTSIVGGYVIEGHVPLEVIEKLLAEKPDIKGIALPGMPVGSPGMPGTKQGEWQIYALNKDGSTSEFMRY